MTEREVLKLALEAFEWNYNTDLDNIPACEQWAKMLKENITAIRETLSQPEQEPVVWMYQDKTSHAVKFQRHMSNFVDHSKTSEIPLYSEPLANHELQCVCGAVWCGDEMVHLPNKIPPQPEQEPVAITITGKLGNIYSFTGDYSLKKGDKVYTTPPQRTWVGLTDDEIMDMYNEPRSDAEMIAFGREVEAKLRSKNT